MDLGSHLRWWPLNSGDSHLRWISDHVLIYIYIYENMHEFEFEARLFAGTVAKGLGCQKFWRHCLSKIATDVGSRLARRNMFHTKTIYYNGSMWGTLLTTDTPQMCFHYTFPLLCAWEGCPSFSVSLLRWIPGKWGFASTDTAQSMMCARGWTRAIGRIHNGRILF